MCSRRAEADEAKAKKEKAAKAAELPTSMDHEVAIPHELARKWHERAREGTSRLLALLCVVDSEVCIFKNCVRKNIYSSSVLGSIVLGRTNIVLGRIVLIQALC